MVAVGGYRPADGIIFFNGNHEHVVLDIRAKLLEQQQIQSRATYRTVARNYGDISLEMFLERDLIDYGGALPDDRPFTPNANSRYNILAGTPMFIETMRNDVVKHVGLIAVGGAATNNFEMDDADAVELHVGQAIEISGERMVVTNMVAAGGGRTTITVDRNITTDIGDQVLIRDDSYANPHLDEVYRITDKYGSFNLDNERYQVDRDNGIVRYRPIRGELFTRPGGGTFQFDMWHPEDDAALGAGSRYLQKPYYFGRQFIVRSTPPVAGSGLGGSEALGDPNDPFGPLALPTTTTNFGMTPPDGEYSNIRITIPPGMSIDVELNGAKLALNTNSTDDIQVISIPFYDPDHTNDYLKVDGVDPDIYISRFVTTGTNNLAIRAIRAEYDSTGNDVADTDTPRGITVEGLFNGVDLSSSVSYESNIATDWSTSQFSTQGIAGKIDFDFGDRITMENVNDEIQKIQGALESLTTIIAGTDINQTESIFSVLR